MELELFENFQRDLTDLNTYREFLNVESTIKTIQTRKTQSTTKWMYKKKSRRRFNPLLDLTESHFRHCYRFSKENMKRLVEILKDDLEGEQTNGEGKERKNQVPVENQIMAAVRYWGGTEVFFGYHIKTHTYIHMYPFSMI